MAAPNTDDAQLEPDRLEGVRPPRETRRLYGCAAAERAFLTAWNEGRAHHAWLLTGPPGVGKASFGWRVARFLLSDRPEGGGLFGEPAPPDTLDVAEDDAAARRLEAGAHPGFSALRRGWNANTKKFRASISVDDVRRLIDLFHMSAADGGWRVALVDPADEMNTAAANALLKLLEEPPARAMFLLVSHAPGRLPPTIRSRCRRLEFRALEPEDCVAAMRAAAPELDQPTAQQLNALTAGSPGEALRLRAMGGVEAYAELLALLAGLPRLDRGRLTALTEAHAGRDGAEKLASTARLLRLALERLARAGALGPGEEAAPGEAAAMARLAPSAAAARIWAEAASECADRLDAAVGLNLDPRRALLDAALYLEEMAGRMPRR